MSPACSTSASLRRTAPTSLGGYFSCDDTHAQIVRHFACLRSKHGESEARGILFEVATQNRHNGDDMRVVLEQLAPGDEPAHEAGLPDVLDGVFASPEEEADPGDAARAVDKQTAEERRRQALRELLPETP